MSDCPRNPAGQHFKDSSQRTPRSGSSTAVDQKTARELAAGPPASPSAAGQLGCGSPFAGQVPLTPANSSSQLSGAEASVQICGPVGTHVPEDPWKKLLYGGIVENQRKVQFLTESLRKLATGTLLPPRFRNMRPEEAKAVMLREKEHAENDIQRFMVELGANPDSTGRQVFGLPPLLDQARDNPRAEEIREGRTRRMESRRGAAASKDSGRGAAGPSRFMPSPGKRL